MTTAKQAEQAATNLLDIINEVIEHVNNARKRNDQLQEAHKVSSAEWHAHETIDDELHNALTKLGD